jgi:hypothetical protein
MVSGLAMRRDNQTDLKIAAYDQQIDTIPAFDAASLFNGGIDSMKGPMALEKTVSQVQ